MHLNKNEKTSKKKISCQYLIKENYFVLQFLTIVIFENWYLRKKYYQKPFAFPIVYPIMMSSIVLCQFRLHNLINSEQNSQLNEFIHFLNFNIKIKT
ncbi:hypothetical protein BpHYR1_036706 [Brachionus plicatilis]|uniref:Transmembrane protein n=1 Tax=Brachionus plicatilis TaxID=10195 RepID=A0A3M7QXQ6_BRAPC|nr:hypothetical protein BpHYR1_036706 [Brachionus plicatilis]